MLGHDFKIASVLQVLARYADYIFESVRRYFQKRCSSFLGVLEITVRIGGPSLTPVQVQSSICTFHDNV